MIWYLFNTKWSSLYSLLPYSEKNYESQIESYLHAYKKLKAHYKNLLNDLTNKFEVEFYNLHKEKCELQAENEILRNKGAGDGIGNLT